MAGGSQQSPAADPDGHFELDLLAEFEAEVCDPAVEESIRSHTADCAHCRDALGELGSLRGELAALPPPAMPASVAARLDAALEAERLARFGPLPAGSQPTAVPAANDNDTVVSLSSRRSRAPRWLWWAAAAVVLLGSGSAVLGVQASLGREGGHGTSAAAPKNTGSGTGMSGGNDLAPDNESPDLLPTYTRQDIQDNLASILRQAHCDAKGTGGANGSSADADNPGSTGGCGGPEAGPMADLTRRTRCTSAVNNAQGTGGSPRAVQHVLFEGTPAFVFVFDDGRIVVVGADCGRSTGPATILFSDR